MTVLLFVGGPDYESHRIIEKIWDMGHIFLFAGLSFSLLATSLTRNFKWGKKLFIIISFSFVIGLIVELLQLFVDRDFELKDIASDVLGASIGYLIYIFKKDPQHTGYRRHYRLAAFCCGHFFI